MYVDYNAYRTPKGEVEHIGIRWIPTHVEEVDQETGQIKYGHLPGLELGLKPGFQEVESLRWEACKAHAAIRHLTDTGQLTAYSDEKAVDIRRLPPVVRAQAVKRTRDLPVLKLWMSQIAKEHGTHNEGIRNELTKAIAQASTLPDGRPLVHRPLEMRA